MAAKDRAQAWIALKADDPEAVSALGVARAQLPPAKRLQALRRFRVFEIEGALPDRDALEDLLHRSTWFYNPHKERCVVRRAARDAAPFDDGEVAVLVAERDGERRPAAERWWRHETGGTVEVREAVVWAFRFERGEDAAARAGELAELQDRGHGLFCNPNVQSWAAVEAEPPLDWVRRTGARKSASKEAP